MTPGTRRADAARNREALVAAAADVFGRRGVDAPLDDVARAAGVANGTLYRHFPRRDDLLAAVFTGQLRVWAAAARDAATSDDPWDGLCRYIRTVAAMQAANRGLGDLLVRDVADDEQVRQLRTDAWRASVRAVRRAQRAGQLRSDFHPRDISLVFRANAGVVMHVGGERRDPAAASRLLVRLLLDALAAR